MSQYLHGLDSANKRVKPILVDADGHLQVDVLSGAGGGDASSANQVTNHTKLDTLATKLDTLDGSVNTIEGCVAAGELAVAHGGLTELASAINSSKVDVNIVSDGASLATSANQTTANGHLSDIKSTHYTDGDAISASSKGQLVFGKDNSNNAHPLHITANGDLEVEIADFVKGQATMASSFPVVLSSNHSSIGVTHGAFTEIEGAINASKMDVNISSDATGLATSSNQSTGNTHLSNILTDTSASKPDFDQLSLETATLITSGSNTTEIDMNGYNHLTVYGSSSVNFGSLCLVRRSTSAGTDYLDGSNMVSANDPTGGSNYHFAATFQNVGNRYVAFRNIDASSQTITLFVVKHR